MRAVRPPVADADPELYSAISRLLLLAAIAAGAMAQGGFFPAGRNVVGALLMAALVVAMVRWPPAVGELRLGPVFAAGALAAWALLNGLARGAADTAVRYALLLAAIVAVLLVCRRLGPGARELLLTGVLAVGVLVALTGWLGVVFRLRPWALPGQGLWRAASVLTYANATAALLVPLALVVLGMLARQRRATGPTLVATVLLIGAGATMSRAGALALLAGLLLLAVLVGPRPLLRASTPPAVGAAVALAGLLPAALEAAPPHPVHRVTALAALAAGLATAGFLARLSGPTMAGATLAVALAGLIAGSSAPSAFTNAGDHVRAVRFSVVSVDRSGATSVALDALATSPMTGVGPGRALLRWSGSEGEVRVLRYVHNEYLQTTTELGIIGGALLAVLLGTLALTAWRGREQASDPLAWAGIVAGLAALAVHSCFDFVWHLPVIPLVAAVLVGVLTTPVSGVAETPRELNSSTDQ